MNMSISEYITEQKIERAKELLTSGNTDIQEIAEQLGFSSNSYFSYMFRRHVGVTPGEYRIAKENKK